MRKLKQSTAVTIKFGPFVDATDGGSAEAGLTIAKANVRLSKNGGDMAAASADQGVADAGAPYDEIGYYDVSLNTTDTNTLGHLRVMVHDAAARPVFEDFDILPSGIYDGMFAGQLGLEKVVIQSTGNDNAVTITGKGTGAGIAVTGGDAAGGGLVLVGGAAAAESEGGGDGLSITGGASAVEDVPSGTAVSIAGGEASGGSPNCEEAVKIQNEYGGNGLVIEVTGAVARALQITSDYGTAVGISGGQLNTTAEAGLSIGAGVLIVGQAEGVRIDATCDNNQEGYGLDIWANGEDGGAAVRLSGHAASGLVPGLLIENDTAGPGLQIKAGPLSSTDVAAVEIVTTGTGGGASADIDGVSITARGAGHAVALVGGTTGDPINYEVENSVTVMQYIRRMGAVLFGKASGGGRNENKKFRNLADTVDRIDATTDNFGNRTTITFDDD